MEKKPVNKQVQREKKQVTVQQIRKSSSKAENKNMVRTPQVTLIAQNTSDIFWKNQAYLNIYAKYIHKSICIYVHIGTTVHMYMQSLTQLPFEFQHLTPGASKNVAVVQNYTSVFDYQVVKLDRAQIIPK